MFCAEQSMNWIYPIIEVYYVHALSDEMLVRSRCTVRHDDFNQYNVNWFSINSISFDEPFAPISQQFIKLLGQSCNINMAQEMAFSIKINDFFSKCDQIRSFLWIW